MKILFIVSPQEDYLADSLLIGMRNLFGGDCVDFPKAEILYKNHNFDKNYKIYGRGFTLYSGILPDVDVDRFRIQEKVQNSIFDLIIFGNIWSQFGLFIQMRPWLNPRNTIILDGADTPQPYPAAGHWWRRPYYWFLPRAHRQFLYFKREWTPDTRFTLASRFIPIALKNRLPQARNFRPVSFSIPAEKIVTELPVKKKDFPKHIVDPDVVKHVPDSATSYAFENEQDYYNDLQISRFGITTKRSGWDCLRHYEIAANATVPCFKDLHKKPHTCAPHGLNESNCIPYRSATELFARIESLSDTEYRSLQLNALAWVKQQTTEVRARQVLAVFEQNRLVSNGK